MSKPDMSQKDDMKKKEHSSTDQMLDAETLASALTAIETDWQDEAEKNLAGWQRAQADYKNLKRDLEDQKKSFIQFANQSLLQDIIPLLDNFNVALKHIPAELDQNAWVQGIVYINKQMVDIMSQHGVEVIDPKGQPFNPAEHEAVKSVESDESEGIVQEVVQAGYKLNGKLIRSARVVVE